MIYGENREFLESKVSKDVLINEIFTSTGWRNKMFVKNELMARQIRITAVKKCRLQDLTDEECLDEGIKEMYIETNKLYGFFVNGECIADNNPKSLFRYLIQLLNGCGYWESNPDGYAYEFELVK